MDLENFKEDEKRLHYVNETVIKILKLNSKMQFLKALKKNGSLLMKNTTGNKIISTFKDFYLTNHMSLKCHISINKTINR